MNSTLQVAKARTRRASLHGFREGVASAVLFIFEELGYLSAALTTEPFRRRGAQSALIAQRIKKVAAVGCKIVVSETLSIVEHSLGNLQKAGFEVASRTRYLACSPTMSEGPPADTVPSHCHDACQMEISEENVRQRVDP
jgi:hypothetical protein